MVSAIQPSRSLLAVLEAELIATTITLRTLTETVTLSKTDIRSREKLPQSLMPPGLLEALPEREAIELLKFLSTKS